jgi:hypothetical protein
MQRAEDRAEEGDEMNPESAISDEVLLLLEEVAENANRHVREAINQRRLAGVHCSGPIARMSGNCECDCPNWANPNARKSAYEERELSYLKLEKKMTKRG